MQRLRALFRILFIFDPAARLDLFNAFPFIRRFFTNRRNIAALRTFGDIAFTVLILFGLFGPQDPSRNISLFLAWGIWWSGVVLSWFFVGKFWCGVCPFLGIGRLLQRFGLSLGLEPPHALRRYFVHVAVFFFAVIIWAESVTDMKHWPLGTALLLLSILLGATLMGFLYKGQAWCRYICPLGKVIGAGATMSMIELRANPETCRHCGSFFCKKGREGQRGCPIYMGAHNIHSNRDCLLCGRCVLLCDNESPRLLLRNPFVELAGDQGRNLVCSFIIPFLAGSQWARFVQASAWYTELESRLIDVRAISFTLLLIVSFLIFLAIGRLGNRLIGQPQSDRAEPCSPMIPILTPLAFSGELAYRLQYLLTEAGQFPAVFGRQFGFALDHLAFTVPADALTALSVLVLLLGSAGSLYVTLLIRRRREREATAGKYCPAVQILVGLVGLIYLWLIL